MGKLTSLNYVKLVSEASGDSFPASLRKMKKTKDKLGVNFREYYQRKFYNMSFTQQAREAKKTDGNHARRDTARENIARETGLSRREIAAIIDDLNSRNIIKMTSFLYDKYRLYDLSDEEVDVFLRKFRKREELIESLRLDFRKIDKGLLEYDAISEDIDRLYELMTSIMPENLKESLIKKLLVSRPDLSGNRDKCVKIAVDMEVCRGLLHFNNVEYIMFAFADKTLPEKRRFINEEERAQVLRTVNDMSLADELDNKYQTYRHLSDYYGRDMIHVSSAKDYPAFHDFCKRNNEFVRKLDFDSMGRGVKLMRACENLRKQFDTLLEETPDGFICEGYIHAHEIIRALNPDSVNTVRLVTYHDGENVHFQLPFMKVGQKGSFVDNGGSGGILVAINAEKGFFESNGIDEEGRRYDRHPYTGIKFEGYQLPAWEDALRLGRDIADRIPGFSYIGWDLTYTEDERWIIVEGNSITQFLGQQSTRNKGAKQNLMDLVNYKGELI